MDQSTYEVRLANWKAIINDCQARPKGQSQKQWLEEHGISDKQFYYWLRKIRKHAFEELKPALPALQERQVPAPAFVEIPAEKILPDEAPPVPAITIRMKKSTIEISSTVSEALVIKLVKAVSHAL